MNKKEEDKSNIPDVVTKNLQNKPPITSTILTKRHGSWFGNKILYEPQNPTTIDDASG